MNQTSLKEKITANKTWIDPKVRQVTNGKVRMIPYRGEMDLSAVWSRHEVDRLHIEQYIRDNPD